MLASLIGEWRFNRSIDDGSSMLGAATIAGQDKGRFDYRERGELTLAGRQSLDAERRYIFAEEIAGFAVLFAETPPRLFHRIALERVGPLLVGNGTHLCGDDRYDSRYEFYADGSFIIAHTVSGSRKAYAMETRYVRASA